ncbi:MAG TPA: FAD-binding oxidoreductase [Patescibacteria group bacterium]|nr:FAD-binding oxidoreductase [Patescibacteria group bacterium]
MRRWNGWGDESVIGVLPAGGAAAVERVVGSARPPRDATLTDVLAGVPASRLPRHRLVADDAEVRVRHARGQSLPDWVALRTGRLGALPDGVAFPNDAGEVRELLAWATATGARVVPYGGGTSVVGGVTPAADGVPWLTISLAHLAGLSALDDGSLLATFGAGTTGPDVEAALRARSLTLGHYPQSWELSTVGGWVAARSSGQQSAGYGRIEALFAGGTVEAPAGTLEMPPHPASAAGPDLRQAILGSEGRLGILTEAALRVAPLPEVEAFPALILPDWERALAFTRVLARARLPLALVRTSTPAETWTNLALAGHERTIAVLRRYLTARGAGPGRCMVLLGLVGRRRVMAATFAEVLGIARSFGAVRAPGTIGRQWHRSRFRTPYLRNALWEAGYAIDTLETAVAWDRVPALAASLAPAIRRGLAAEGERVHAFTHLSHVYPTGSSLYTTFVFRLADDPDVTLERWRRLKTAASEAIVRLGGTISHQHGVGSDHAAYLAAEKGELGMAALGDLTRRFDPAGIMHPGVLLPEPAGAAEIVGP